MLPVTGRLGAVGEAGVWGEVMLRSRVHGLCQTLRSSGGVFCRWLEVSVELRRRRIVKY